MKLHFGILIHSYKKKIGVEENFKPVSKMMLGLYVDFVYSCTAFVFFI